MRRLLTYETFEPRKVKEREVEKKQREQQELTNITNKYKQYLEEAMESLGLPKPTHYSQFEEWAVSEEWIESERKSDHTPIDYFVGTWRVDEKPITPGKENNAWEWYELHLEVGVGDRVLISKHIGYKRNDEKVSNGSIKLGEYNLKSKRLRLGR